MSVSPALIAPHAAPQAQSPIPGCAYSVTVETGVTRCMTEQQYQSYQASQDAANHANMQFVLVFVPVVVFLILFCVWFAFARPGRRHS